MYSLRNRPTNCGIALSGTCKFLKASCTKSMFVTTSIKQRSILGLPNTYFCASSSRVAGTADSISTRANVSRYKNRVTIGDFYGERVIIDFPQEVKVTDTDHNYLATVPGGVELLTIAISGGPFLGLLGTVVGVMITFAAIAAAGDVNVNSIAPGIAAALVATVAGLAVAIPALFGYNWLSIQIKNVYADTQVFADEFVTRSAELYSN